MNIKGVLQRLLPFAATFAVAVFITSFFVDLSGRRFRHGREWEGRCGYERMMRENEQLRNENLRLRNELENRSVDLRDLRDAVPPPPIPPAVPIAPRFR